MCIPSMTRAIGNDLKMKIYLINKLVDNCAWETIEAYKDFNEAKEKMKLVIQRYTPKNDFRCRFNFEIREMELK